MKALRVLVVEDDAMIAMLLADMFAGMGHDVCAIEATEAGAVAAAVQMQAGPDDRRCAIGRWKWRLCRGGDTPQLGLFRMFSSAVIFQRSGRLCRTQWRSRSLLMSPTSFGPFIARLAPRSHLEGSKPPRCSSRTATDAVCTLRQMKSAPPELIPFIGQN